MGSTTQVRDAGVALRDALQAKIRDATFDETDRDDFERIHLGLTRRIADFASAPRYGQSAPQYDDFISKAQNAAASVNACTPGSAPSIQRAKTDSQAASNALPAITGRANLLAGSLRLGSPPVRATAAGPSLTSELQTGAGEEDTPGPNEPYYQSLVKLFPVEAVTLYPMAVGIAGDDSRMLWILVGIIALVVIGLRVLGTRPAAGGPPDWPAVGVALVSFALYAAALGAFGVLYKNAATTAMLLSFLTIIWVAFVPYILRKRPEPSQP
jgi:hypothetical protein